MDLWSENSPEACAAVGLDCGTCIHRAAANLAHICPGVEPGSLQQLFVQLYQSPACQVHMYAFERAYLEAANPQPALFTTATAAA